MTNYCGMGSCLKDPEEGHEYCAEHLKRFQELKNMTPTEIAMAILGELAELKKDVEKIESDRCDCESCINRRRY